MRDSKVDNRFEEIERVVLSTLRDEMVVSAACS